MSVVEARRDEPRLPARSARLDPVGEIDDALHVAIADGANVIKPGRRSECPNS
jgi:hypothetical protein